MSPVLEITKRYTFEAAHQLPWHNGKCARPHGHSYILDVTVRGPVKETTGESDSGMVMDFADISTIVKPVIAERLDHFNLNDLIDNSTAERLVLWLVQRLGAQLPGLCRLRLYETATGWVEWSADT